MPTKEGNAPDDDGLAFTLDGKVLLKVSWLLMSALLVCPAASSAFRLGRVLEGKTRYWGADGWTLDFRCPLPYLLPWSSPNTCLFLPNSIVKVESQFHSQPIVTARQTAIALQIPSFFIAYPPYICRGHNSIDQRSEHHPSHLLYLFCFYLSKLCYS
jgi:hypothetical protein